MARGLLPDSRPSKGSAESRQGRFSWAQSSLPGQEQTYTSCFIVLLLPILMVTYVDAPRPALSRSSPTPIEGTLARGPVLPQTCPPWPGFCMSENQGLSGLGAMWPALGHVPAPRLPLNAT